MKKVFVFSDGSIGFHDLSEIHFATKSIAGKTIQTINSAVIGDRWNGSEWENGWGLEQAFNRETWNTVILQCPFITEQGLTRPVYYNGVKIASHPESGGFYSWCMFWGLMKSRIHGGVLFGIDSYLCKDTEQALKELQYSHIFLADKFGEIDMNLVFNQMTRQELLGSTMCQSTWK